MRNKNEKFWCLYGKGMNRCVLAVKKFNRVTICEWGLRQKSKAPKNKIDFELQNFPFFYFIFHRGCI